MTIYILITLHIMCSIIIEKVVSLDEVKVITTAESVRPPLFLISVFINPGLFIAGN